ncbi:TauD/TfdA family dioxygenase [Nocardia sp. Marseille-Q1738]
MSNGTCVTTLDELYSASFNGIPTFDSYPRTPVDLADPGSLSDAEQSEIVRRYVIHGFAIIQLREGRVDPESTEQLAAGLGMGAPFVPPLYTLNGRVASRVSRISAAANSSTTDATHPSFGRTVGQALHTDGTLQEIGEIKSTILACKSPAAQGGTTMLFNASAAYRELLKMDPEAALALATTGCLIRTANINGSTESNDGPAFAVNTDGELITRYSVTETDAWNVPEGVEAASLWRGVEFLDRRARLGNPEYVELDMQADQMILFGNCRISHGRHAYRDSPERQRCLYRSLHVEHPVRRRSDRGRAV